MSDKKEFTFKNIDLAIKWMNHYFPDSKSIEFEEKVKELHKISGVTIFLLSDELNFIINDPIPNYIYCDKPSYVKER